MNKKAISPVISVVMLMTLTLIIGGLIFQFSMSFISLAPPPLADCNEVNFDAGIFIDGENYFLDIMNIGNIDIQGLLVKSLQGGSLHIIEEINEVIEIGSSVSFELEANNLNGQLLIVPLVLSGDETNLENYACRDEIAVIINLGI
jgi:hypothetical protein